MTPRVEQIEWPHGSVEERRDGLPERLRDPGGTVVWSCAWRAGELAQASFQTPGGECIGVRPGPDHPIFGATWQVVRGDAPVSRFARVSFRAPRGIPAMDEPGALPPGAGTAILGFLAARARASGEGRLRYAGPYPTAALFDALLDCFRPVGDPARALAAFTEEVETRAVEARMDEVPVDFEPAPFERRMSGQGACAQLRDGVEKLFVGGHAFSRDAAGARRLRRRGEGYVAVVEIAGEVQGEVAEIGPGGELVAGPHPLPPIESPLSGRSLPAEVVRALADALPPRAPVLLRAPLRDILEATSIVWGDPGPNEAIARDGRIVLHPALADGLEGRELLEAIARAVETPAQRLAQRRLAERLSSAR